MGKSTRRSFLAVLGLGGVAAVTPKIPEIKEPKCTCPVEHYMTDGSSVGCDAMTVHISSGCPVHGHLAEGDAGCGVYDCQWEDCPNPRTRGLIPARERQDKWQRRKQKTKEA